LERKIIFLLPNSSKDLALESNLVLSAATAYEPLTRFHDVFHISPFRFEDFCSALCSLELNPLLHTIHIQLLKLAMNGSNSWSSSGTGDPIDMLYFHMLNEMTWPEILALFLQQQSIEDGTSECIDTCRLRRDWNYFELNAELRLKLINQLLNCCLQSAKMRMKFGDEEYDAPLIENEKRCRACGRACGRYPEKILHCSNCPASCCASCASKTDECWFDNQTSTCDLCIRLRRSLDKLQLCAGSTVDTCLCPIGYDRIGNKYWYAAQRVIVE
jgi:hypothetical protein